MLRICLLNLQMLKIILIDLFYLLGGWDDYRSARLSKNMSQVKKE